MLKNKKIKQIFRVISCISCILGIATTPCVCAETASIPVEIPCVENFTEALWIRFDGQSKAQYTLTTSGIRDTGIGQDIIEVANTGLFGSETYYGLKVHVVARCISSDTGKYVSNTGATLSCNKGEGLKIKVFSPNGSNQSYVGILTITRDKEKELEFNILPDIKMNIDAKWNILDAEPRKHDYMFEQSGLVF